jgi:predicted Zn-dependent protease
MKKILFIIILALILSVGARAEDKLLEYAKSELKRSMSELSKEQVPPYYISFNITDVENYSLRTSFGKTEQDGHRKERILDIDLRVGDYNFDNTHIIRGNAFNFGFGFGSVSLPLTNDEKAIKAAIWYAVDKEYKKAVERYQKAVTNKAVKIKEEDSSADFSKEKPQKYVGDEIKFSLDTDKWKQMIPKISAKFSGIGWIYTGETSFEYEVLNKWFVSSEGAELRWAETNSRIMVYAKTKAEDGMSLPLYKSYFAFDPKDLPQESKIAGDVDELIATMDKLRKAPLAEPYSGPAILSGEASGVFFHEIFGHRVEGHREKDPNSSQTFKNQIGKKILPDFIDVIFDPTVRELGSREISGFYQFDDQGTKSQKVETVKNGVFQKFLMARSPIEGFPTSNGHGRKQAGYPAVSRQSNLIVQANEAVSGSELKELLRKECKQQNKEYGLYFDVVEGGFTFTGREIPNAFNVNPLVVYKVFADGRPDEIVRGVDLIGTPLTTFSNIIKAGGEIGTFNGICGAESGGVPVSASSKSLLVSLIEVQRKQKSQAKLPILNAPESGRP